MSRPVIAGVSSPSDGHALVDIIVAPRLVANETEAGPGIYRVRLHELLG
jgi:hypothetical protein